MSKILSKDEVVDIIVTKTGKSSQEINDMISETVSLMDNMVNEDGAAFVVANKLGVEINPQKMTQALTIEQLVAGQSNVTVVARIKRIYNIKEFQRKDNTVGRVRNLEILGKKGTARVSLWDKKASLIEEIKISSGDIIRISGASTKIGYQDSIELTLSSHGMIEKIQVDDESDYQEVEKAKLKSIGDLNLSDAFVSIEGKIIDRQGIVTFDKDGKTGKVTSFKINDTTGTIRITFWNENCETATSVNVGDAIKLSDLRIGENRFNDLELTYTSFSSMDTLSNSDKYSDISISSGNKITVLTDIKENMNDLTVSGLIQSKSSIRTFKKDNGTGQVANFNISDISGLIRVNLWNELADTVEKFSEGTVIEFTGLRSSINKYSGEIELASTDNTEIKLIKKSETKEYEFKPEPVYLSQIAAVKRGLSIQISVSNIFEAKEINKSDGSTVHVQNATVIDKEGTHGRLAAWDDAISILSQLEVDNVYEISSVRIKPSDGEYDPEITISADSKITKIDGSDFFPEFTSADKLSSTNYYQKITLDQFENKTNTGHKVEVQGTVVQAFKLNFYDGCSSCGRKVSKNEELDERGLCDKHGDVEISLKVVMSLVIDDSSGTGIVTLFNNEAEKLLGQSAKESKEMIKRLSDDMAPITKSDIKMKEIRVKGIINYNEQRENYQLQAHSVEFVENELSNDELLDNLEEDD